MNLKQNTRVSKTGSLSQGDHKTQLKCRSKSMMTTTYRCNCLQAQRYIVSSCSLQTEVILEIVFSHFLREVTFFSRYVGKRHFFLREIDKNTVQYLWPGAPKEMANNLSSQHIRSWMPKHYSRFAWGREKVYLLCKVCRFDKAGFCMISHS